MAETDRQINRRIARRLVMMRTRYQLTVGDLVLSTGVPFDVITGAEDCSRPLKSSELGKLCDYFSRETWYFLQPGRLPKEKSIWTWRKDG